MMTNTETKTVRIVPKCPKYISDILQLPERIDEEMTLELNVKEIVRCMQYADLYDEDNNLLTPENFNESKEEVVDEPEVPDPDEGDEEDPAPEPPTEEDDEEVTEP